MVQGVSRRFLGQTSSLAKIRKGTFSFYGCLMNQTQAFLKVVLIPQVSAAVPSARGEQDVAISCFRAICEICHRWSKSPLLLVF